MSGHRIATSIASRVIVYHAATCVRGNVRTRLRVLAIAAEFDRWRTDGPDDMVDAVPSMFTDGEYKNLKISYERPAALGPVDVAGGGTFYGLVTPASGPDPTIRQIKGLDSYPAEAWIDTPTREGGSLDDYK